MSSYRKRNKIEEKFNIQTTKMIDMFKKQFCQRNNDESVKVIFIF